MKPLLAREKLVKQGIEALSNRELLSLIIGSGILGFNAQTLASEIFNRFDDRLAEINFQELTTVKGIGSARASRILASFELAKRLMNKTNNHLQLISPEQIVFCVSELAFYKQEHCVALYVDSRYRLLSKVVISKGTLTESLVHPREIFFEAIQAQAAAFIVAHNHPSGDPSPSEEDIYITRQLSEAGKIMGMRLLDHVIIAHDHYVSLREKGILHDVGGAKVSMI